MTFESAKQLCYVIPGRGALNASYYSVLMSTISLGYYNIKSTSAICLEIILIPEFDLGRQVGFYLDLRIESKDVVPHKGSRVCQITLL